MPIIPGFLILDGFDERDRIVELCDEPTTSVVGLTHQILRFRAVAAPSSYTFCVLRFRAVAASSSSLWVHWRSRLGT